MGTGIYRTVKGKTVELTRQEIKATIMKAQGFETTEQYNKYYDIMRNKIRSTEAYEGKEKQSVVEVLYREAKSKLRYGEAYKPSVQMQRIKIATTISSGKALQKALQSTVWRQKQGAKYTMQTYIAFEGLISKNAKAQEIYETIKDPVKREQALKDFANKMHAELDARGRATGKTAVAEIGEVIGSSDYDNFDYSQYIVE